MKYTIERTENGCIQTLDLGDGNVFVQRDERAEIGCASDDNEFWKQVEDSMNVSEEIKDKLYEVFDISGMGLGFMELAELLEESGVV